MKKDFLCIVFFSFFPQWIIEKYIFLHFAELFRKYSNMTNLASRALFFGLFIICIFSVNFALTSQVVCFLKLKRTAKATIEKLLLQYFFVEIYEAFCVFVLVFFSLPDFFYTVFFFYATWKWFSCYKKGKKSKTGKKFNISGAHSKIYNFSV